MAETLGLTPAERMTAEPLGAARLAGRMMVALNHLIVIVSSAALVIASCVLTYSVVVRNAWTISTDWQDEVSVFLIVGAVFMSAAAIQAQRGHIGIEAIVGLLPMRVNRVRVILVDIAICTEPITVPWGNRALLFRDPDVNLVNIFTAVTDEACAKFGV